MRQWRIGIRHWHLHLLTATLWAMALFMLVSQTIHESTRLTTASQVSNYDNDWMWHKALVADHVRDQRKQSKRDKQQHDAAVAATHRKQGRHPIFYNLYVPMENHHEAIEIAKEQMQERAAMAPDALVYYTLIGYPNISTSDICQPSRDCHQRAYQPHGDEVDTLQALWEYCQEHPRQWVTYLHDKGSFHASYANERLRQITTRATLACRQFLVPSSSSWSRRKFPCNVCGAAFHTLPQYHAAGNMWTAKCSYVRDLYEPRLYAQAMERMYNETLRHPVHGNTTFACLQPSTWRGSHVGTGRYASERWVFSHPTVKPCSSMGGIRIGRADLDFVPQLVTEPRQSKARFTEMTNHRFQTSFARLEGRLWEWKYIYDKSPPPRSWIWQHYRDGFENGTQQFLNECQAVANATRSSLVSLLADKKDYLD